MIEKMLKLIGTFTLMCVLIVVGQTLDEKFTGDVVWTIVFAMFAGMLWAKLYLK